MIKLITTPVLVLAILLGACSPTGQFTSPTVASVIAFVKNSCGYIAQESDILNLITAGIPGLNTATAIGEAVCRAAVMYRDNRAMNENRFGAPLVQGIPVRGVFIK